MKQPKYTSAPIAGVPENPFSLKTLFVGHRRSSRFYEATDSENTLYLLWVEFTWFGVLLAYPCVLSEAEGETMFFDNSAYPDEEKNARLLARWDALSLPDRKDSLNIRELKKKEFKALYRKYRAGNAETQD